MRRALKRGLLLILCCMMMAPAVADTGTSWTRLGVSVYQMTGASRLVNDAAYFDKKHFADL